jgi:isopenicillin N synthase-like dioxygenase
VQVVNHGFSAALMQDAMQMCREFFALPMEEKERYSMTTSSGIGYGRRFAVKEGARVDWVDRLGFWSASDAHRQRQPLDIKRPAAFK